VRRNSIGFGFDLLLQEFAILESQFIQAGMIPLNDIAREEKCVDRGRAAAVDVGLRLCSAFCA
jgi:hypothetical protein